MFMMVGRKSEVHFEATFLVNPSMVDEARLQMKDGRVLSGLGPNGR